MPSVDGSRSPALLEALARYIPRDRRLALVAGGSLPDRAHGAALFADLSGFTALAEQLVRELGGARGPEELTRVLDDSYGALIAEVHGRGGSVIGFSGDAVTCWFDGDDGRRAVASGLALQRAMPSVGRIPTPGGSTVVLGLKVGIAAGPARRFVVGDPDVRRFDVIAGSTVERMAEAERLARDGDVIVDAAIVRALCGDLSIGEPRGEEFVVAYALRGNTRTDALEPGVVLVPEAEARSWVPAAVYERLARGHGKFLAELRPAVAVLVQFTGIAYDADDDAGLKLDAYVRRVQRVAASVGGTLVDLTIGDKGSYAYVCFGAPVAHSDDESRAVAAALELLGSGTAKIGVSGGILRAGNFGGPAVQAYGVLGHDVNVAARLMALAAPGEAIVARHVADRAQARFEFDPLPPVALKGLAAPLAVSRLIGQRTAVARASTGQRLVGRAAERNEVLGAIAALSAARPGRVIVVEGDAGIGKSHLVAHAVEAAKQRGAPVLLVAGDPIQKATPWSAWRPALAGLLAPGQPAEPLHGRIAELVGDEPDLTQQLPLLEAVLSLGVPENAFTARLTGEARAALTRDLVARLIRSALADAVSPPMVVVDDAFWVDSPSLMLLPRLVRELPSAVVLVVSRPWDQVGLADLPEAFRQLLHDSSTRRLRLGPLSAEHIAELACIRLGVEELPPDLAKLLVERAEGHPFFCEELISAMRESGTITVGGGRCVFGGARERDVPRAIQGLITSRIDRLPAGPQLTLKVASVVGRVFTRAALEEVHPVAEDPAALLADADVLVERELTVREQPAPDAAWAFRHATTHDAAYGLLLHEQRRALHLAVARHLERAHAGDIDRHMAVLAHHYVRAETSDRALDCLEKASELAVRAGAFREALVHLEAIDTVASRSSSAPIDESRRARWLRLGAEAHFALGATRRSAVLDEEALVLLGEAVPGSDFACALRVARELLFNLVRWALPAQDEDRSRKLEAARAYSLLSQGYYHSQRMSRLMWVNFAGLRAARQAGPSPELSRFHAIFAAFWAAFRIPALSLAHERSSFAMAEETGSPASHAWLLVTTAVARVGVDPWAAVDDKLRRAADGFARLGQRTDQANSLSALCLSALAQGAAARGLTVADEMQSIAAADDNPFVMAIGRLHRAAFLLLAGDFEQAIVHLDGPTDVLRGLSGFGVQRDARLALALVRCGRTAEGEELADRTLPTVEAIPPFTFADFDAYTALAEVYFLLWEQDRASGARDQDAHRAAALRACVALQAFARMNPVGEARALLYRGRERWLSGRTRAAVSAWRRGKARADRAAAEYDGALLQVEMARHGVGEHARDAGEAIATFERLGALADRGRARTLVG